MNNESPNADRRQWLKLGGIVLAVACAYGIYAHWFAATPEQRIEKLLRRGAEAAEGKSIFGLSGIFSNDFHAGQADKPAVLAQAQELFKQSADLQVSIKETIFEHGGVAPDADRAKAVVVVVVKGVTGGMKFQGIGDQGGDAFLLGFVKLRGDWLIESAERLDASSPEALAEALPE